ncbi:MAG: ABC transporter ATP-binding protein, partial [Steroidobacteraceae bacterium]
MTESIVSATGLGKTIKRRPILRDVSLSLAPGNVVGLIGKNGAGKTTLLELLLGFSPPTAGRCALFGYDSLTLPAAVKARIGFAPQQDELVNAITAAQQLSLTASLHAHWNAALVQRLSSDWEMPLDRRIQTMSPGERQKLSTLIALGHEPELLVLDEPAASLDPIARRRFLQQLLDSTAARSRTVLFSSHIVSDLERAANQIWILREGAVVWQGELDALKESVVRLKIRGRQLLPASLGIPNVLTCRSDQHAATAVVSGWDASMH